MSYIKLLLLLASLSCLSLHCKKESELDKLPAATKAGANTFGCLMNGKAWPVGRAGYLTNVVNYWNGTLELIYDVQEDPFSMTIKERIVINAKKIYGEGEYFVLFNDLSNGQLTARLDGKSYNSGYLTNYNGYAVLKISRLDTVGPVRIVAGTFNFSLFDESGHSKLHVTKGRFDLVYYP